jgi:hypothetical protein
MEDTMKSRLYDALLKPAPSILDRIVRPVAYALAVASLVAGILPLFAHGQDPQQKSYSSPDEAMKDMISAVGKKDRTALGQIFGPDLRRLLSGDSVQDTEQFEQFSERVSQKAELAKATEVKYLVNVGNEGWPFPVPIVKKTDKWFFDTKTGVDELLARRVGRNEIYTILVCKVFAVAQWEYFLEGDWDNDLVPEFAQKFRSSDGQKDGLYWPTAEAEAPSPLGPLVAYARYEGYSAREKARIDEPTPYHGYYFKILKAQGPMAPGGRNNYLVNGNMIGGFALVAWPATYGSSGVKTFIVGQLGRVYEKDLGPQTEAIANAMVEYNPDPGWKVTEEPDDTE